MKKKNKQTNKQKRLISQTSGSNSRTESCRGTVTARSDGTMTLFWNLYISFAIVLLLF